MIHGGGANVYIREHLRSDPSRDYRIMRTVRADPDKAHRCTLTVAVMGDHECRVNSVTREVFDRAGYSLRYVGRSTDVVDEDIARWQAWLTSMRLI